MASLKLFWSVFHFQKYKVPIWEFHARKPAKLISNLHVFQKLFRKMFLRKHSGNSLVEMQPWTAVSFNTRRLYLEGV